MVVAWVVVVLLGGTAGADAQGRFGYDARGRFLMHGVPRFVLGVYDSGLGYANDPATYERTLFASGGPREMGDLPINLYLNYHYGEAPIGAMHALMDTLGRHGIMYLQTGNCFETGSHRRIDFAIDQSDDYVRQFAAHPAAAGYYIMDECRDELVPETAAHHQRLKTLDAGGLTLATTLARGYVDPARWAGAADILATDPYPLFGREPAQGYTHFQVADFVAQLRAAVPANRPVVSVLQFFKFTSDSRWPTAAELRSHAVMSVVEGAQGLVWWEIGRNGLQKADGATRRAQMATLKGLVQELASLERVLVADDAPGALVGNSTLHADPVAGRKAQLQKNIATEWLQSNKVWYRAELAALDAGDLSRSPMLAGAATVRTRVKVVDGVGYVFAYNYTDQRTPVQLTWHQSPGAVREFGDGRAFPVAGATWSDSLGPYESRIYVVANGGAVSVSPASIDSYVVGLYREVMGRLPAAAETQGWVGYMAQAPGAAAARTVARAFLESAEFHARPFGPAAFIRSLYRALLGREPDAAGHAQFFAAALEGFNAALPAFSASREGVALRERESPDAVVRRLYREVLGRSASAGEVSDWTAYLASTGDIDGVARAFFNSAEYLGRPRPLGEHVRTLYRALLGREPEADGHARWVGYFASQLALLRETILASAEFHARF
jgi:hypothetical protein